MSTIWSDTSQHQGAPIDDSYPHAVYSFRTNSGSKVDTLGVENATRVKQMLNAGKLEIAIAYYFFRPGQSNCDGHRELLERSGLWEHPRLASMVDVEGDKGSVSGDQSFEVNDEVARMRTWYGDGRRVIGYWNPNADPGLWLTRPPNFRLVIPQYGRTPGDLSSVQNAQVRGEAFAHQFTQSGRCAPWSGNVDLNYSPLNVNELLGMLGMEGKVMGDIVTEGAAQLRPFEGRYRQIRNPQFYNVDNPNEAWPYDSWADVWNEVVWDGFKLPDFLLRDDAESSLIGWTTDTNKRVRRLEDTIKALEAKIDLLLDRK